VNKKALAAALVILAVLASCGIGNLLAKRDATPTTAEPPPVAAKETPLPADVATPVPVVEQVASDCPSKAVRIEPQGLAQGDGSFIAQLGQARCVAVFEGRIWEAGKGIQNRHDIVMINGALDGFHFWEGNGWLIPSSWDPSEFACLLWEGKQENWISQGITPLPVRFWSFDEKPSCSETASTSAAAPLTTAPTSTTTVWPSTTEDAADLFGATAPRWESCPGENLCWHLIEGDLVDLSIPDFANVEGWTGSQTIPLTDGPVQVEVVGATVRPR